MAKNLTYLQNHDGNQKWLIDRFESNDRPENEFVYLCQLRDSNPNGHDIVVIPKSEWPKLVEMVNEALAKEFK